MNKELKLIRSQNPRKHWVWKHWFQSGASVVSLVFTETPANMWHSPLTQTPQVGTCVYLARAEWRSWILRQPNWRGDNICNQASSVAVVSVWMSHRAAGRAPAKADGATVCGEEAEERGERSLDSFLPRTDNQMSRGPAQWSSHDGMNGSLKRLGVLIQCPVKTGSSPTMPVFYF